MAAGVANREQEELTPWEWICAICGGILAIPYLLLSFLLCVWAPCAMGSKGDLSLGAILGLILLFTAIWLFLSFVVFATVVCVPPVLVRNWRYLGVALAFGPLLPLLFGLAAIVWLLR